MVWMSVSTCSPLEMSDKYILGRVNECHAPLFKAWLYLIAGSGERSRILSAPMLYYLGGLDSSCLWDLKHGKNSSRMLNAL